MKRIVFGLTTVVFPAAAQATELRVLLPAPVRPFVQAAATEYAKNRSDIKVNVENAPGFEIVKKINADEQWDIVIVTPQLALQITDSSFSARVQPIAQSQAVIAYRKGGPKPDAASPESVRALAARVTKISYSDPALGGSSSVFFVGVAKDLGIADEIRGKAVVTGAGRGAEPVDRGKAEMGVAQLGETVSLANVETTPLLPSDPRSRTQFVAGPGPGSKSSVDATEFISFLRSDALAPLKQRLGLQ